MAAEAPPALPTLKQLTPPAPPAEDGALGLLLAKLKAANSEEVARELSTELAALLKTEGIDALHKAMPVIVALKGNSTVEQTALVAVTTLAESMGQAAEPFLVSALPITLQRGSSKDASVRTTAEAAAHALMALLCPALSFVLPTIFEFMQQEKPWQSRCLALSLLAQCVHTAPSQLASCLPQIVPELTPCMTDTKKEVKKAAKATMAAALTVVGNSDIEPVLADLVQCIVKPSEVPELMHKLGAVVFVQTIDAPALAVMVPLLVRGLREKTTATKRQTAVIIENMSKLVENPIDAAPFLPLLLPALEKSSDSVSDPEARSVCERGLKQLNRLNNEIAKVGDIGKTDVALVYKIIIDATAAAVPERSDAFEVSLQYLATVAGTMIDLSIRDPERWTATTTPCLTSFMSEDKVADAAKFIHDECVKHIKHIPEEEEIDDGKETLCDCEFTLAYGTKILLHNTRLRLKRGYRYGLLGPNDCGKTTLMRSMSQDQIEAFPSELRTVFVEADILGELSHLTCTDYVLADERIHSDGITRETVREALRTNAFTEKMLDDGVSTLSGGWRMKLALARAMLLHADILLLDEPTNHLDVRNVKWVKDYLNSLETVTSIMVSHDSGLLDDVCSHILQFDNLKLHTHLGNLSEFVKKVPEAKSFFELKSSKTKFTFPQPGPLDGVKSKGKALMKMEGVSYKYPINDHFTITGITVQVSLSSRVGCVGPNGAGKSTMIKCLTGEVEPSVGTRWAHPSLRMAYVAQHAFHHIEQHLSKTPNEYIRWRYQNGEDKEAMNKVTMVTTDEENTLMATPFEWQWKDEDDKIHKEKRTIEKLTTMRRNVKGSKEFEYECKFRNKDNAFNEYLSATKLGKLGFTKWVMMIDQKIASRQGMYVRALTQANVEKHLEDCGLDREYGSHFRMNALSGGQKVKVVIGAAMWNQPHVVILDEPTNYLDRDSLGALAGAIQEYEGGVVIITHNDEFCRAICPERWVLEKMGDGIGRLDCQGDPEWMQHALDTKVDFKQAEEMVDGAGNVTKVKQQAKKLSRKEEKAHKKRLGSKIKNGEPLDTDEEEYAYANGLKG